MPTETNRHFAARWILAATETTSSLLRVEAPTSDHLSVTVEDEILHLKADELCPPRYARETSVWLERRAEDLHIDRITVLASPKVLDALRDAWSSRFAIRVSEHVSHLIKCQGTDSARHQAIRTIMRDPKILN